MPNQLENITLTVFLKHHIAKCSKPEALLVSGLCLKKNIFFALVAQLVERAAEARKAKVRSLVRAQGYALTYPEDVGTPLTKPIGSRLSAIVKT